MHAHHRQAGKFTTLRCLCAAAVLAGCAPAREPMPRPLPQAPANAAELVEPVIENAFVPHAGGQELLGRTVYRSEGGGSLVVEARDLILGPGRRATQVRLEGAGVLEVRQGSALLSVGQRSQALRTGATASVDHGETFTLLNDGAAPLLIRLYVVIPR